MVDIDCALIKDVGNIDTMFPTFGKEGPSVVNNLLTTPSIPETGVEFEDKGRVGTSCKASFNNVSALEKR